ncbi:MAG: dioxygenase [Clostridia bacterium]
MPSLFVAHGSPMVAIEDSAYGRFLDDLSRTLPRPRAVVIFSAHFEAGPELVHHAARYQTMYDFGGFPDELYRIQYEPPGDPDLAAAILHRLTGAGIDARPEIERGLDHGAWTILHRLYPAQDVPVVEMSVNKRRTPEEQFRIGRALAPLGEDGVLFLGSGVTVHNFTMLRHAREDGEPTEFARGFESWLEEVLREGRLDDLLGYWTRAPYREEAVPTGASEHFAPLLYVAGTADGSGRAELLYRDYLWGVMSNSVYRFQ